MKSVLFFPIIKERYSRVIYTNILGVSTMQPYKHGNSNDKYTLQTHFSLYLGCSVYKVHCIVDVPMT